MSARSTDTVASMLLGRSRRTFGRLADAWCRRDTAILEMWDDAHACTPERRAVLTSRLPELEREIRRHESELTAIHDRLQDLATEGAAQRGDL